MAKTPEFWLDDDGSFWISALDHPDPNEAGEALRDLIDGFYFNEDDGALVCEGRGMVSLRDCPLDDCEGHHDEGGRVLDCPEFRRDVWAFTTMERWGNAWPDIEKALAEGRVVILADSLVVRGGEVHWAEDCECERCDAASSTMRKEDVLAREAPSIQMFEQVAETPQNA